MSVGPNNCGQNRVKKQQKNFIMETQQGRLDILNKTRHSRKLTEDTGKWQVDDIFHVSMFHLVRQEYKLKICHL